MESDVVEPRPVERGPAREAATPGEETKEAAALGDAAPDITADQEGAPEEGTPEADRLFKPPTSEEAAHVLRELNWGEQFVAANVVPARGPVEAWFYSLEDAVSFFNDSFSSSANVYMGGSYKSLNVDKFVVWIRDVVGDVELGRVLEERLSKKTVYNDQVDEVSRLLAMRMAQYELRAKRTGEDGVQRETPAGGSE